MDPMTLQHTATHHGDSFEELLKVVLEFANNAVVNSGPSSIQVGSCQDQHHHEEELGATGDGPELEKRVRVERAQCRG